MANPLFNEPMKCRKCGREFPADKAEGHACIPLWVHGQIKAFVKVVSLLTVAFAVGFGFGLGVSYAMEVNPLFIDMHTAIGRCDDGGQ